MLDFLLLFSSRKPIEHDLHEYFNSSSIKESFLDSDDCICIKNRNNTRCLYIWSFKDQYSPQSIIWKNNQYTNFFDGFTYQSGLIRTDSCASIKRKTDFENINNEGIFCYIKFSEDDDCLVRTDLFGVYPIFWGKNYHLTCFSNNPHIAAKALSGTKAHPKKDELGLGWMLCHGNPGDERTGYADVKRVQINKVMQVNPSNFITFKDIDSNIFDSREKYDESISKLNYLLINNLKYHLEHFSNLHFNFRTQLSGGFDSRVVLAMIMNSKYHDLFTFHTNGYEEHADVICSKLIAQKLKLNHLVSTPQPLKQPKKFNLNLDRIYEHLFLTSGTFGTYDLLKKRCFKHNRTSQLNGLFGETIGSFYCAKFISSLQSSNIDINMATFHILGPLFNICSDIIKEDALHYYYATTHKNLIFSNSSCDIYKLMDLSFVKKQNEK